STKRILPNYFNQKQKTKFSEHRFHWNPLFSPYSFIPFSFSSPLSQFSFLPCSTLLRFASFQWRQLLPQLTVHAARSAAPSSRVVVAASAISTPSLSHMHLLLGVPHL
ncbi:hypothetical protein VIGAN_03165800, partial [Vigna angularis var. angularis]